MDINQLKYVVELARQCNFSRAADVLFITQPALSQQIQKLESEIGFPLFSRSTKRVELTFAGRQFVKHAENTLEAFSALEDFTVQTARAVNDTLVFGTSAHSSKHVSACIPKFTAEFPHARFRYKEAWDLDLLDMLRAHQLDVAFVLIPKAQLSQPGIKTFPLREDSVCIMVTENHPFAQRESVSLDELTHNKLIFTAPDSVIKLTVMNAFSDKAAAEENTLDLVSKDARMPLLSQGAVCFSMYGQQMQRVAETGLCVIPIEPRMEFAFCLAIPAQERLSVTKRGFIEIAGKEISRALNG